MQPLMAPAWAYCVLVVALQPLHGGISQVTAGRISPALDPKSDKTFFGPPSAGDYGDDHANKESHAFNNELYPRLQKSSSYDSDYVKDENDDNGEWAAQHTYDELRAKLAKEKRDLARAAQKRDQAGDGGSAATADGDGSVGAAKERLARAEANMKDCERQLAEAQDALKEALAAEEARAARLKADKASSHEREKAVEEAIAAEGHADGLALKSYDEELQDVWRTEAELAKAEARLRALRGSGHKKKSSANSAVISALASLLVVALANL